VTAEAPVALRVLNVSKEFEGFRALHDVSLDVSLGSVHAVIGPNGAGKTTLLEIITGVISPQGGRVLLRGGDVTRWPVAKRARHGLGRSFQVVRLFDGMRVRENIEVAAAVATRRTMLAMFGRASIAEKSVLASALDECALRDLAEIDVAQLSQGDRKRVEIAMVVAGGGDVLALDEPTAGMSKEESTEVTDLLARLVDRGKTLLLVEHDMEIVARLADHVTVLDHGEVLFSGTPAQMVQDEAVRLAYLGGTAPALPALSRVSAANAG
jgi:branched-chain amino acid transport system ATP-binding protein